MTRRNSSGGLEELGGRRGCYVAGKLQKIFEQGKMPEEWRDSVIVPIFKEKGDIQDFGKYRGIKMIPYTMKIWERVIDRRLREETTIGE